MKQLFKITCSREHIHGPEVQQPVAWWLQLASDKPGQSIYHLQLREGDQHICGQMFINDLRVWSTKPNTRSERPTAAEPQKEVLLIIHLFRDGNNWIYLHFIQMSKHINMYLFLLSLFNIHNLSYHLMISVFIQIRRSSPLKENEWLLLLVAALGYVWRWRLHLIEYWDWFSNTATELC